MMLGFLLARQGVRVTVLEKHADFNRDFRGDTVHPSTLELFHELGLLEEFLQVPHQKLESVGGVLGDYPFHAVDFRHLPVHSKFVALMPQWDFLDFVSSQAKKYPQFDLRLQHEVVGLTRDHSRITGVEVRSPEGMLQVEADLVVGCDGRHSTVRQSAQMEVVEFGVPIDVLWFRLSRRADDPEQLFGTVNYGRVLILVPRGDYSQAGLIIQKGAFDQIKSAGIEAFREDILKVAPYVGDRISELYDWDQIKLLTVQINRLKTWYRRGLVCLGDAAHAMSPAWGVGINLAIQDAVAAANLLAEPLRKGRVNQALLGMVQCRREFPARVTQFMQTQAHRTLSKVFENPGPVEAPWQFKLALQLPGIQHALGRAVGLGIRPEHIGNGRKREQPDLRKIAAFAAGALVGIAGFVLLAKNRR
jgi:2-polyprenyl-6-methoxyphenol hydroxylase-like FAD-dependent oxidoreductase